MNFRDIADTAIKQILEEGEMPGKKNKQIKKLHRQVKRLLKRQDTMQKQLEDLQGAMQTTNGPEESVVGRSIFTEAEVESALEATEDAEEFDDVMEKIKH